MESIVYFGTPSSDDQPPSAQMQSLGLRYNRANPAALPMYWTPNRASSAHYAAYKHMFPLAAKANYTQRRQSTNTRGFVGMVGGNSFPDFKSDLSIIWNYHDRLTDDQIQEVKTRFHASEITFKGKFCFQASLNSRQLTTLATDRNVAQDAPSTTNGVNIGAAKAYSILMRIVDMFYRVHQFATYPTETTVGQTGGVFLQTGIDLDDYIEVQAAVAAVAADATTTPPTPAGM
jgi:hypothetical protein